MPKIFEASDIEYTTWIKLQLGGIELTFALPSINAQNIQPKECWIRLVLTKINYDKWSEESVIKPDKTWDLGRDILNK